jgi:hypothetical protein
MMERHDTVDAVFFVQQGDSDRYEVCVSIKGSVFILDETYDTEDEAVKNMVLIRGE